MLADLRAPRRPSAWNDNSPDSSRTIPSGPASKPTLLAAWNLERRMKKRLWPTALSLFALALALAAGCASSSQGARIVARPASRTSSLNSAAAALVNLDAAPAPTAGFTEADFARHVA